MKTIFNFFIVMNVLLKLLNAQPAPLDSMPNLRDYEDSRAIRIEESNIAVSTDTLSFPKIIHVPFEIESIQGGINLAKNGDTVLVDVGTYLENINFNGKNIVVGSLFLTTGDNSYISQTVIDGNSSGSVVKFENGESQESMLCGFTLTNGSGTLSGENHYYGRNGGGIFCSSASPTFSNLIIIYNNAFESGQGGGIYFENSTCRLENTKIQNCVSVDEGGAIFLLGTDGQIINTVIENNKSINYDGAGIYCDNSNPTIKNTIICKNSSPSWRGAGIGIDNSSPILINATIVDNSSQTGGGGIFCFGDSHPVLMNTIVWGNSPEEIELFNFGSPCSISISFSDVGGGEGRIITGNNTLYWLDGNINANPIFVDENNGDYHLSDFSPCISAGIGSIEINGTLYYAPNFDYEGNQRPNPSGSMPDLGAYENSRAIPLEGPNIVVSTDTLDFGQVFLGDIVELEIEVKNTGNRDLLIEKVFVESEIFTVDPTFAGIDPLENEIFKVSFKPINESFYQGKLVLTSNDFDQETYEVLLEGHGVRPPSIVFHPESLHVTLEEDQKIEKVITITNEGFSDLKFNIFPAGYGGNYTLHFDGVNNYIEIPDDVTLQIEKYITLEAWIKFEAGGTDQPRIISKGPDGGGYELLLTNTESECNLEIRLGPGQLISNTMLYAGNWYHVAATYDGSCINIYINGYLDNTMVASGNLNISTLNLNIGQKSTVAFDKYRGYLGEVRIWNKAKTEIEIREAMNYQLNGTESGLVGYWKLDENTGNKVFDQSLNQNDGIIHGIVDWRTSDSPLNTWLYADYSEEICPVNESKEIIVTIDASNLIEGKYHGTIIIYSNDPIIPEISIPVFLEINPTGIRDHVDRHIPKEFVLNQNYPNPFNPKTVISYSLPVSSEVKLEIYNSIGQNVKTLVSERQQAGFYNLEWDASGFASGIYYYHMVARKFEQVRKMILIK